MEIRLGSGLKRQLLEVFMEWMWLDRPDMAEPGGVWFATEEVS